MRTQTIRTTALVAALGWATCGAAWAGTVSWDGGGGDGLWSTAANWDTDTTPTSTDDVQITLAGTYTVTLDVDTTVASLTLGNASGTQTLAVTTTRTLTVSGNVTNQDTVDVSGALTITNGGAVDLTMGTQDVSGTLTINGGTTRVGPSTSNTGDGEIRLGGTHTLEIDSSYTEQPSPASSLVLSGAVTVTAVGVSATFINNDFMQLNCNDVVQSSVTWTNNATTEAERGVNGPCTVTMNGPVSNPATGTLRIYYLDTGVNPHLTLALAQDLTNEGLIELRGTAQLVGSTLSVGGGSGTLTNLGQIRAYLDSGTGGGGTIAAQVINQGTITVDSDSMTITNGGLVDLRQGTQTVPSPHNLTINGGTTRVGPSTSNTGDGEVRLGGTQTLEIDGSYTEQPSPASSLVLSGAVTVTAVGVSATFINNDFMQLNCNDLVDSSITWTNNATTEAQRGNSGTCTVTMNGPVSNPATGTLRVYYLDTGANPQLTLALAHDLTNEGLIELRGTGQLVGSTLRIGGGSGTLTNLGQIRAYLDSGTGGGGTIAAQVINQATITVDSDSMTITNGGLVDLTQGTQDVPTSHTLTINGGTTRVGPSTSNTGDGEVRLGGTHTLEIDGSYTEQPSPASSLVLSGAVTVTAVGVSATFINDDFMQLNCNDVVQSSVTWTNNATTQAERGNNAPCTVTMNGPVSNPATGTLRVYYFDTGVNPKLTLALAHDLTNEGLIELRGTAQLVGSTLTVGGGSGTLTNLGQIRTYLDSGPGGGGTIAAQVINQGTITVDSDSMTITNGGLVDLTQGTQDVPSSHTLTINGGTTRIGPSTSNTGDGEIRLEGTHTLEIDGSYTEQPSPASSLVLSGAVTVTAVGVSATFINNDFMQLNCNDVVQSSVTWTNNATTEAQRGINAACTVTMNGPVSNPATGTLRVYYLDTGAHPKLTLALAQDLENEGLIELRGNAGSRASLRVGGGTGTLTNLGQIHVSLDAGSGGDGSIFAQVINAGTVVVDMDAAVRMDSSSGEHQNSGSINILTAATLTIPDGALYMTGGSVGGDGSFVFQGTLLHGHGQVSRPFSASFASVAAHDGSLTIGDATSTAGFSIGGSLDVASETVTLLDSDGPAVSGPITIGGGTLISASGLTVNNALSGFGTVEADTVNNGAVTVGASPGILTVMGSYTQNPAGVLNIEIGGLTAGTEFDRLVQTGALTSASLDGTLNVSIINDFIPSAGQTFTFLTSNARVGQFATVNGLSGLPCAHSFNINYNSFDVTLETFGGCDDGDPCTDNVCNTGTGTCEFPLNYDPDTHCCNPDDGTQTVIDDNNVCTEDVCNPDGTVDHNDLTPSGFCCDPISGAFTAIDDSVSCTDDVCNADGSVDHTSNCLDGLLCDPNADQCVECLSDADCPTDRPFCDSSDGLCKQCLGDADCHPDIHCDLPDGYCRPDPVDFDPDYVGKNRFITIATSTPAVAAVGGGQIALRVKLVKLYDETVCPPRTPDLPDLSAFEEQVRWVGALGAYSEDTLPAMPDFLAAPLVCTPMFRDWSQGALDAEFGAGVNTSQIHFYGKPVVPCSLFEVQAVHISCADLADENCYSAPVQLTTALWGDTWESYGLVNFIDINEEVLKYKGIAYDAGPPESGAPPKVRAMLRGNIPPVDQLVNFMDISLSVDGYKAIPYKETGPTACP